MLIQINMARRRPTSKKKGTTLNIRRQQTLSVKLSQNGIGKVVAPASDSQLAQSEKKMDETLIEEVRI